MKPFVEVATVAMSENTGITTRFNEGKWSAEEDEVFLRCLKEFGKGKWAEIAKVLTSR